MNALQYRKSYAILLLGVGIVVLTVLLAPAIGSTPVRFNELWQYLQGQEETGGVIVFQLRLPRVLLALLVGGALSVAGAVLQALLRNPLATPYTLGISSGGALGAVVAIKLGWVVTLLGFTSVQLMAFVGSLATILLVYILANRWMAFSVYALILIGVTLSFFFSALILLIHYLADFTQTQQMIRWMMGGLDIIAYPQLLGIFPVVIVLLLYIWRLSASLNLISFSADIAATKGVEVDTVQKQTFVAASLLTGSVVALSGPIGFVGLIVPHFLRLLIGPDLRFLIPAGALWGGVFLTWADTLARTVMAPVNLPVGIITALLGGPFFLYLLLRRKQ